MTDRYVPAETATPLERPLYPSRPCACRRYHLGPEQLSIEDDGQIHMRSACAPVSSAPPEDLPLLDAVARMTPTQRLRLNDAARALLAPAGEVDPLDIVEAIIEDERRGYVLSANQMGDAGRFQQETNELRCALTCDRLALRVRRLRGEGSAK